MCPTVHQSCVTLIHSCMLAFLSANLFGILQWIYIVPRFSNNIRSHPTNSALMQRRLKTQKKTEHLVEENIWLASSKSLVLCIAFMKFLWKDIKSVFDSLVSLNLWFLGRNFQFVPWSPPRKLTNLQALFAQF